MMSRIIYCCGDSHTAGGELVDDLIWPQHHPGFYRESELDLRDPIRLERWRRHRAKSLSKSDPIGYQQWHDAEHEQAWPARLGRLLGCEVINTAVVGSSMEWVVRQTMTDVAALLQEHDPRDLMVIIQPTTWVRLQRYDGPAQAWDSFQLSDATGMDEVIHNWFVMNEDDNSLMTRWLLSMIGMCGSLLALGLRPLLIEASSPHKGDMLAGFDQLADLIALQKRICDGLWHGRSMQDLATAIERPRCPDLHWSREVHQSLADDLARILGG